MTEQEWRDILVVAEARGREPHAASYEVMGKARDLADRLGARVLCAWPGDEGGGQGLIHRGADELVVLEGPPQGARALKATVERVVRDRRPEMVLAAGTALGQELAGRLAAALEVGVMANCVDFDLYEAARLLVGRRPTHQGAVLESVTVPTARPQVATLRPGAVRPPWPDESRFARTSRVPAQGAQASKVKALGAEAAKASAEWRGRERLVVGGALLDEAGFEAVRVLAGKLDAGWAATRLAVQAGLAAEDRALRPWDMSKPAVLCIAAGIEDPYEFSLAVPWPKQLVLLGEGPLERVAQQVVPGEPGALLRALAERAG